MKLFRYLFYKLCRWSEKVNHEWESHAFNAALLLSLAIFTNIMSVLLVLELTFELGALEVVIDHKYLALSIYAGITLASYILFERKYGYERLSKEFSSETASAARRSNIATAAYIVLSPALFICAMVVGVTGS
jgi:uncharacterized membrane protein